MTKTPTILATSGGYKNGERIFTEFNHLVKYSLELSGTTRSKPKLWPLSDHRVPVSPLLDGC